MSRAVAALAAILAAAGASAQVPPGAPARPTPPRPAAGTPGTVPGTLPGTTSGGAPRAGSAAAPDPAFEAARAAFEALPEAARRAVQDALVWTGDHSSVTTGAFGRRTYEAIAAYQKRVGAIQDGVLDERARAALLAQGASLREGARFRVAVDPATGAVIGVPERLVPRREAVPSGARWSSPDGKITLNLLAYPPGETDLPALFERATAPQPNRQVTYKVLRANFLVVSGETATGKFYTRYATPAAGAPGPSGAGASAAAPPVRGFSLSYDKALAKDLDRVVIAVANSFAPFGPAPGAAGNPVAGAGAAQVAGAQVAGAQAIGAQAVGAQAVGAARPGASPATAPPRPAATGLVVGPRRVLTAAAGLDACAEPRAAGGRASLVRLDAARGLALLDAEARLPPGAPPAIRDGVPAGPLVALAADGTGEGAGASVTPAEVAEGGKVTAPLQPGAAGAPVLDRAGALVGLVARYPAEPRRIAGIVPPLGHPLVPGGTVALFLRENGLAPTPAREGPARTLGEVAAGVAVVRVECGR